MTQGKLYLISMPIGNYDDITLRALNTLREVDFVICEEFKTGSGFLKQYSIKKELIQINEHNEKEDSGEILDLLKSGKNIGLISDHGTPLLEDPGSFLVRRVIQEKIPVTVIPGASSILSALVLSGFDLKKFIYLGLLPPKKEERKIELLKIKTAKETIILIDTPYRLIPLLNDIRDILGKNRDICLATNLTMENEKVYRGKVIDILSELEEKSIKKVEFVLILKAFSGERIGSEFEKKRFYYRNGKR
jgi:16S rRNA (cytidine1402-2'-O)-methyltransferase